MPFNALSITNVKQFIGVTGKISPHLPTVIDTCLSVDIRLTLTLDQYCFVTARLILA